MNNKTKKLEMQYDEILNLTKKDFFDNTKKFTDQPIDIGDYIKNIKDTEISEDIISSLCEDLELEIDNHSFFAPSLNTKTNNIALFYLPEAYKNAKFCIKPTEEELELGILVPGHKFTPFLEWDIPPSEARIYSNHSLFSSKKHKIIIADLLKYISYYPYGVETYLDEEGTELDPEFFKLEDSVSVNVFDFGKFYREHNFQYGDSLIFTLKDYIKGEFSVEYRSAESSISDMGSLLRWIALMEEGLENALLYYQLLLTTDEQLNFAYLANKDFLLEHPVIHIEGFLELSNRIKMTILNDNPIFLTDDIKLEMNADFNNKFDDFNLHNMLNEKNNTNIEELESLDDILMYLGHDLTSEEFEAYIKDELYHKSSSFENVWARCFEVKTLEFQEFALLEDNLRTQAKKLWNKISKNYEIKSDQEFGPIREKVLAMKDEHLQWIRSIMVQTNNFEAMFNEDFVKLAELSSYLSAIITLLNSKNPKLPWKNKQEAFSQLDIFAEKFNTYRMKWDSNEI
jgi:hypothetical protein